MSNDVTRVNIPVQQEYASSPGDFADSQASGAYIFRPDGSTPTVVANSVQFKVISGPLFEEIQQTFSSWIYQLIRVYKDKDHAEVEFTIGPISTVDGIGKEVITQIKTNMTTNKVFYTDSNGRDFLKRVRDYRPDWSLQVTQPVAGNYYPLNLRIYTSDDNFELSVLVDRANGGSSIKDGQIEVMFHRRMLNDDGRGVGEALNETVCLDSNTTCHGLTVRDYRSDWPLQVTQPVAGNYYPLNLGIYTSDDNSELSVLVDRATGGSSIKDGQIEVMFHRRMLNDTGNRYHEALDEKVCVDNNTTCHGLTIRGTYYISANKKGDGAPWRRTTGQEIYSPLLLAFTHENSENWISSQKSTATFMEPNYTLPPNVALITLQELSDGNVLLRLGHLYEADEDAANSSLAEVDLHKFFGGKTIKTIQETSLTANQDKSQMKWMDWNVEDDEYHTESKPHRGEPVDFSNPIVRLGPMEIRTFLLSF